VGLRVEVYASAAEFLQRKSGYIDFQTELAKANIRIPVVFMTGHGDIAMTVRVMKAGAIEFLPKPFRDLVPRQPASV
jgi:FixJ family two-component response regulator